MNSDQARQRAERHFRKDERAQDGRKAIIEYESQARATREKTARLKELRLAKEAEARSITVLFRHTHKVRQLFGGAALSNATV
jgi:hypothetical protein